LTRPDSRAPPGAPPSAPGAWWWVAMAGAAGVALFGGVLSTTGLELPAWVLGLALSLAGVGLLLDLLLIRGRPATRADPRTRPSVGGSPTGPPSRSTTPLARRGAGPAESSLRSPVVIASPFPGPSVEAATVPIGDELWRHWQATDRLDGGRLPGALVGPVPESVYSTGPPDPSDPFADRQSAWELSVGPSSTVVSGPPGGTATTVDYAPSSAETRAGSGEWFTVAPSTASATVRWAAGEFGGDLAASVHPEDWVAMEAFHPAPPHLRRAVGSPRATTRPNSGPPVGSPSRPSTATCVSCDRGTSGGRAPGRCPSCRRAVCTDCRRRSVLDHGHTLCRDCRRAPPPVPQRMHESSGQYSK
jgi:hypothetical protein